MIEVAALHKSWGEREVLRGVSARFAKGEVAALVGPSGGGKSTLLRCLNGLEDFQRGEVRVAGSALVPGGAAKNRAALKAIRARVGMVFQQWNLFAHRTALGNVMEAPVHVKGVGVAEARDRARALLDRVGLSHREGAYPHEMSGGEQQRVALARALITQPWALLLDEPFSALDAELRVSLREEFARHIAEHGIRALLVTHDEAEARAMASAAWRLQGGGLVSLW